MTALHDFEGIVLVCSGDTPLITEAELGALARELTVENADAVVATVDFDDPTGYGRVITSSDGRFQAIVEERDATPEQRRIREVGVSVYAFSAAALRDALPLLSSENAAGEFYLTDVPGILAAMGRCVRTTKFARSERFMGCNDRWELSLAETAMRRRTVERHARNGVTLVDPDTTYIGSDVRIGENVRLLPMTHLEGSTRIGDGAEIGPNTRLINADVHENARVSFSVVSDSVVGRNATVGPFAHLRNGVTLGVGASVGNFVEMKNAQIGAGVSAKHLSYIGDAEIGDGTNIGAGSITCNWDGFRKHRTQIGRNVFIGTHTTLVAPIAVGDGAMTAAGSVVTQSVPAGAAAFGRARQETKEGWAEQWRTKKSEST
jgi:bifunctional UDP-N-acetylglucosamine pyrophosphorylase/glucosamine-1-phosphate N-acetyltransferase